ncbi:MAG: response regulator [Opitutales bacterium]
MRKKTIVTIDDSRSIRETVRLTLASLGYEVHTAEDGAEGLSLCQRVQADLVLTDLNMPRLDGINLIARLRATQRYRFTPILMLTTESQDEKKAAGKRAGATGWIIKPFDPQKLAGVVRKLCPAA